MYDTFSFFPSKNLQNRRWICVSSQFSLHERQDKLLYFHFLFPLMSMSLTLNWNMHFISSTEMSSSLLSKHSERARAVRVTYFFSFSFFKDFSLFSLEKIGKSFFLNGIFDQNIELFSSSYSSLYFY